MRLRRRFTVASPNCAAYVPCAVIPVASTVAPFETTRPGAPLVGPISEAPARFAVNPAPKRLAP